MDCSTPGFSVHGILQARILEWVAITFYEGSSWSRNQTWVSHIKGRFFTIWATRETPLVDSQRGLSYHYLSCPPSHHFINTLRFIFFMAFITLPEIIFCICLWLSHPLECLIHKNEAELDLSFDCRPSAKNCLTGASLVLQWLGVQCGGLRFNSWSWNYDPYATGQLSPLTTTRDAATKNW